MPLWQSVTVLCDRSTADDIVISEARRIAAAAGHANAHSFWITKRLPNSITVEYLDE